MEPEKFLLFNLKFSGFLSKSGHWTSDVRNAAEYSREEAVKYCSVRYSIDDGHVSLPVSAVILAEIENRNGTR